jgi:UDP-N-acetylmuramyl pentapeptide phosphotransferase/UDP-N-acetylglucosamine-1-phosphate transferase
LLAVSFALTVLFFKLLIPLFFNLQFLDKPNHRSSHINPTPLGGGLVIIPLVIFISYFAGYQWSAYNVLVLLTLFCISLIDDFKNIKALYRLAVHFFCIFIYVHFSLLDIVNFVKHIYDPYFTILIYFVLILILTGFINAFNFMDGIDGITSVQVIFLTCSLIFFNIFLDLGHNILFYCLLGTIAGFLVYNWHPAKIFLGDSGSIPLGFLMLYSLIDFAIVGYWVAALILPMYYLLDTSITLFYRVYKRENFWESHSQHFYQKAARNNQSHKKVCFKIILLSAGLFIFSILSIIEKNNLIFLIFSFVWCIFFLLNFSKQKLLIKQ